MDLVFKALLTVGTVLGLVAQVGSNISRYRAGLPYTRWQVIFDVGLVLLAGACLLVLYTRW